MMSVEAVRKAMASMVVNMTAQLVKSMSLAISMPYPIAALTLMMAATIRDIVVIPAAVAMARWFLRFCAGFLLLTRLSTIMVAMPAVSE